MKARFVVAALLAGVTAACGASGSPPGPPAAGASTPSTSATGSPPASAWAPATPSATTSLTTSPGTTSEVGPHETTPATPDATGGGAAAVAAVPPVVTKMLVVVVENHSLTQMARSMPYTFSLAKRYGYANHYTAIRHPSLPNYLAIASGSTHGVVDDRVPASHPLRGPSVFGAALAKGKTAGTWADAMTTPCQTTNAGTYVARHNPWTYFVDERASCRAHDVPLTGFDAAVRAGTLPNAGMLVPDLCHDAHNCSLATADSWFKARMRTIMAGPDWRAGRLAVVLTADEDDKTAGNRVLTVVAHPSITHRVVRTPMTHYSLTRLYAEVTHTAKLGNAARAPSMARAFGLRTS